MKTLSSPGIRGRRDSRSTPTFWGWAERIYADPNRRAWLLRWFWLISLGFLAVGFAAIALSFLGRPF